MGNRTFVNILLGLVIIILAGYLIYTHGDRPAGPAYTAIDPASINRITIKRRNKPQIVLAKTGKGWWLEQPFRVHANPMRIHSILQLMRTAGNSPFTARDPELQQLGLGDDALTLLLNDHKFVFGNTDPISDARYLRYGDTVYLIEDDLYFQLRQGPAFFAGTRLIPETAQIIQLTFPRLTLIREGGRWTSIPARTASNDKAALLAERWKNAEATVVNPASAFDSLGAVTVHLKDEVPITLDVVSLAPTLVLARSDLGIQYFMGNYKPEHLGLENLAAKTNESSPP